MYTNLKFSCLFLVFLLGWSCTTQVTDDPSHFEEDQSENHAHLIHDLNDVLLEIVVQDGFPPPVASRVFAYPNIAAYEIARLRQPELKSFSGQFNAMPEMPVPPKDFKIDYKVAMVRAFRKVATHMTYRDYIIEKYEVVVLDSLKSQMKNDLLFEKSLAYGDTIAAVIKNWADSDGYNATRNMPKFTVTDTPGSWQPTPPTYGEAIEPHWMKLRPFAADSNSQFRMDLSIEYSESKDSEFYKLVEEVKAICDAATEDHIAIARFWDCNPAPTQIQGHLMSVNRQNTPGGHWLGITKIAAKAHDLNLAESCEIYANVLSVIADAFKQAWDTKYATNFVRPETFINEHIDPSWRTKLESPLFPEYTSAHSLQSAASAEILTARFGTFAFVDSTNVPFGYPPRSFESFKEAADEAAISRVYGGIHYMPSCILGKTQGERLGQYYLERIKTR